MRRLLVLIFAAAVLAVAGCASTGSPPQPAASAASAVAGQTGVPAAPSSGVGAEPSSDLGSAEPSSDAGQPSSDAGGTCTTHACIAQTAQASMVGTTAEDGSVITKATCYQTSVKYSGASDTYTVSCNMTYTDGSVWNGLVTLLEATGKVSWQPESEVS